MADLDNPSTHVIVRLPAEIDMCVAPDVTEQLRSAFALATIVVADLTGTTFCDSCGVQVLLRAFHQASSQHCQLRLALPNGPVLRVLQLLGVQDLMPIYPTLAAALDGQPDSADGAAPRARRA